MKTVLLFARDPGGANTVAPLVGPLQGRGHRVSLIGKDVALQRFVRAGLAAEDLSTLIPEHTPAAVAELLRLRRPDFLITGTSGEDFTERWLWQAARALGIPSFAILDQWLNYGIRFSRWPSTCMAQYEAAPEHPFLPARLIVMDEYARDEVVRAGIMAREDVLPLGQPHFEALRARAAALPPREALRERLGLRPGGKVVTFVSEPVSADFGSYWGYTENTVLSALTGALGRLAPRLRDAIQLAVKPHPREEPQKFDALGVRADLAVSIHPAADPLELIHASDVVCGMSSMMLIEAALCGAPIISILTGLRRASPFVLERRGLVRSVRADAELDAQLSAVLGGAPQARAVLPVPEWPVKHILDEMEKMP